MMKSKDFISMLKKALNSNTSYCWGMWGQIINDNVINTKAKQYPSFYTPTKVAQLKSLKGKNYFGFDCVCLVKSILWGWEGSTTKSNGGAKYDSNGVPDVNADTMITKCKNVSTDFSKIVPGALVWMKGHVGVYIGNGQCIECTTNWTSKVLQSTLKNIGAKGQFERSWTKWGLLPYVDYSDQTTSKPAASAPVVKPSVSTPSSEYYPAYTGTSSSLDAILAAIGVPAQYRGNYNARKPIAEANGIANYEGTGTQNTMLKNLAKTGKLKKVGSAASALVPQPQPTVAYYPAYTGKASGLDEILRAIGVPSKYIGNYNARKPIAEANGIKDYKGTGTQNIQLKNLAKTGKLKRV